MTITGYSNAIVDAMLGWLKGLANWVLRLFNLAGSVSASPLLWLSRNWLKLLILLMLVGIAADILVWLVRWRPHWVWFRKERVIVNDEQFLNEATLEESIDLDDDLEKNWQERDYVVASTVVKRSQPAKPRPNGASTHVKRANVDKPSTIVKRRMPESRDKAGNRRSSRASFKRGEKRRRPAYAVAGVERPRDVEARARRLRAERETDLFGLDGNQPDVTDFYEDEVFNVSNLPSTNDYPFESHNDN